jgi:GH15 family glucan-1,4-alpha-glucosidase
MDLLTSSIELILKYQDKSGAYVASPNFPTYHYCWLRDGSFIAYSMDLSGQFESSDRFYRWVGKVVNRYAGKVDVLASQLKQGKKPDNNGILNTRFTLDGVEEGDNGWGNFQVDGYGSWLWGLAEHVKLSGDTSLLADLVQPIETTIQYLKLVWKLPNYDCWEEHPNYLHPYSLATTYGGLAAMLELQSSGALRLPDLGIPALLSEIKAFLKQNATYQGTFTKHILPSTDGKSYLPDAKSGVDSSLLGLAVPYAAFDLNDPTVQKTIQAIEKNLWFSGGGVFRYKADVYYGGGEWVLLAGWLGWHFILTGELEKAIKLQAWIESVASPTGDLPEQVSEHLLAPSKEAHWIKEWGPVATPLLWSHAMYIILSKNIQRATK